MALCLLGGVSEVGLGAFLDPLGTCGCSVITATYSSKCARHGQA